MKKTRNLNCEGSRKVMPDGRITYKAMIGRKDDGKPHMLQVYQRKGETASQLKERFEKALKEAKSKCGNEFIGTLQVGSQMFLGDYVESYIKNFKRNSVKPSTFSYYMNMLHHFKLIEKYKIVDLKPFVLQKFVSDLVKSGLSYRTVKGVMQILKAALNDAVTNEIINKNPAESIRIPKANNKKSIVAFSVKEQKKFLAVIRGNTYELFFVTAITTGMRVGEILGLRWENVDLTGRRIYVKDNLVIYYNHEEKTKVNLGTPKSSTGERIIPISEKLLEMLQKEKEEQLLMFGENSGFVFKNNSGLPYKSRSHFSRALKKICAENDLPVVNLHALRHTFATRGLEAGIAPRVMQKLLGHSDWQLFFNTYSHVMPELYNEEMGKLAKAIEKINIPEA